MVSLLGTGPTLSSARAHPLFLAGFQAQLLPFEKGLPLLALLTVAKCTPI